MLNVELFSRNGRAPREIKSLKYIPENSRC